MAIYSILQPHLHWVMSFHISVFPFSICLAAGGSYNSVSSTVQHWYIIRLIMVCRQCR